MKKLTLGKPSQRQCEFFLARNRYIAYGGARGGGKSWAVRKKAAMLALCYAGCRILILRRTLPELRENHVRPLQEDLAGIAHYRESEKTFTFSNKSLILCGYCDGEKDLLRYQGQEFDFIFIDEATQMEEYVFIRLRACLRGTNGYPKRMYLTCNPGGVGHAWVKRLFIDRRFRAGEQAKDYCFIPARVYDNKALLESDPTYLSGLESLPQDLRRAWLEGNWDLFEGQYFEEFDRDIHCVAPFALPEGCRRFVALDYGLDMLACLWIAELPDASLVVYRELHEKDLIVSEAAKRILALSEGEKYESILLPPDLDGRQKDSGKSVLSLFSENGLCGVRADNRRVPGWLAIKELLKPVSAVTGQGRCAKLTIFSSCPTLIANLPALMRDRKNPTDAATHPYEITHICDALRYFALHYRERNIGKPSKDPLSLAKERALRKNGHSTRRNRF